VDAVEFGRGAAKVLDLLTPLVHVHGGKSFHFEGLAELAGSSVFHMNNSDVAAMPDVVDAIYVVVLVDPVRVLDGKLIELAAELGARFAPKKRDDERSWAVSAEQ